MMESHCTYMETHAMVAIIYTGCKRKVWAPCAELEQIIISPFKIPARSLPRFRSQRRRDIF